MRWLDGIIDSMDMNLSKLWELGWIGRPGLLQSMGSKESGTAEQLNNNDIPLQYSCLESSMDRRAWQGHEVIKSKT